MIIVQHYYRSGNNGIQKYRQINAWLKIYSRFKIPLNLSLILPAFQLQFGQAAVLPLLQVTRCGTPGMDYCDGTVYTGTNIIHVPNSHTIDCTSVEFVSKLALHTKSLSFPVI